VCKCFNPVALAFIILGCIVYILSSLFSQQQQQQQQQQQPAAGSSGTA
jgi:sensor domain CHASE-containing protein